VRGILTFSAFKRALKTLKGLKGTNGKRRSEAKFSDNCLKKKMDAQLQLWKHISDSGSTTNHQIPQITTRANW
jgi:hypothetical protein